MTDLSQTQDLDASNGSGGLQEVWTSQKVLNWSSDWLRQKTGVLASQSKLEVELLLSRVLGLSRMQLYLQLDRPLLKEERDQFKNLLRRRAESEPIAYILGYRDFYRHQFLVSKAVLIPRPDTEILVEQVCLFAQNLEEPSIIDVGTGSGCVALSIAAEVRAAKVLGIDISDDALAVALRNQSELNIPNARFERQDALDLGAYSDTDGDGLWDVIVSNPPYIPVAERSHMSLETLKFEPHCALFSGDDLGLKFYEFFASRCGSRLKSHGRIFLEFGFSQAEELSRLFERFGWRNITIVKDLSGHDRVLYADRP